MSANIKEYDYKFHGMDVTAKIITYSDEECSPQLVVTVPKIFSISVRPDLSNCGGANIHQLISCDKKEVAYEMLYKYLTRWYSTNLPSYPRIVNKEATLAMKSLIFLSGNVNSEVIRFAKWVNETHPEHIELCESVVKNPNSSSMLLHATFFAENKVKAKRHWARVLTLEELTSAGSTSGW